MRMYISALILTAAVLFISQGQALAQDHNRGGFTLLVNAGYALHHDSASGRSEGGQAGLNLGIGGFLTRNLALLFRVSETSVQGDLDQASGVLGGPKTKDQGPRTKDQGPRARAQSPEPSAQSPEPI